MNPGIIDSERIQIQELIGSGGLAEVFKVQDLKSGQYFALKLLYPHLSENVSVVSRLEQELALSHRVNSPHILRYHNIITLDGRTGIVMDLHEGGDLKTTILEYEHLPATEALRITREILQGLDKSHQQGIIHGDIKPQNILFSSDGRAVLSDFGLARSMYRTSDSVIGGTADYAAPELLQGGLPDLRADLYATAVVLFEMLCGSLPYQGNSPYKTVQLHLSPDIPRLPENVDDEDGTLQAVINKGLAKDPALRFQTARAFIQAIDGGIETGLAIHQESKQCPECGSAYHPDFPLCIRCGYHPPVAIPARGRKACSLLLTGPGQPGDRLQISNRSRLLEILTALSADTHRLEKRIPRLPFVLIKQLDYSSASALADEIRRSGMTVEIMGNNLRRKRGDRKRIVTQVFHKVRKILPRIMAISGFAMYQTCNIVVEIQANVSILTILGTLFLALSTGVLTFSFIPRAYISTKTRRFQPERLAALASQLNDSQARSVVQRLGISLSNWEKKGAQNSELAKAVSETDEIVQSLTSLSSQLRSLDTIDGPDDESFQIRRDIESTIHLHLDRLLRYCERIERLSVASGQSLDADALTAAVPDSASPNSVSQEPLNGIDS